MSIKQIYVSIELDVLSYIFMVVLVGLSNLYTVKSVMLFQNI